MGKSVRNLEKLPVLLLVKSLALVLVGCTGVHLNVSCIKSEKDALLKFKQGLTDDSNRLSSWVGEDCCAWKGVACSSTTGHIIKLDLHNQPVQIFDAKVGESYLGGEIKRSLLNLTHLNYLDLSFNNFSGITIPKFLGSLKNLKYLNLSHAYFGGKIPHHLGNLSHLQSLDLSENWDLIVHDLHFISTFSSLKYLDLSGLNLIKANNWLHSINMIPGLLELRLSSCHPPQITHFPDQVINLTSLAVLGLSSNDFTSTIPHWLFNLSNIQHLDLRGNIFQGSVPLEMGNYNLLSFLDLSDNLLEGDIPEALSNLCNLKELYLTENDLSGDISTIFASSPGCIQNSLRKLRLSGNDFNANLPAQLGQFKHLEFIDLSSCFFHGPIPSSIGRLSNLRLLDFSDNYLNGSLPKSFGKLYNLRVFDIRYNFLDGKVSKFHFSELSNLNSFLTSANSLVFDIRPSWIPPFQLQLLALSSCRVGPQFPKWLQAQKNISILHMSNASISDSIPDWFENISSNICELDLSHNEIQKNLPKLRKSLGNPFRFVYLNNNKFEGPLSSFPSDVVVLDVSNNLLQGNVRKAMGNMMPQLGFLFLSNNNFNGIIPVSLCKMENLRVLDLSKNQLVGEVPNCWRKSQRLAIIDLSNNVLSGHIPVSLGSLPDLLSLHLQNNSLQGKLPTSLRKLKDLRTLDLSGNAFDGFVPSWIGENLSSLRVLNLHSNKFGGDVPQQLCQLVSLHILNLANNKMTGKIPACFNHFAAMIVNEETSDVHWDYNNIFMDFLVSDSSKYFSFEKGRGKIYLRTNPIKNYDENALVRTKGAELKYTKTLSFLFSIDLSRNHFVGQIPNELMVLSRLQNLNLSENNLKGRIPPRIGNLKMLESLDLSRNELSGSIPQSIADLNFLSYLNLSFNNLSGQIPLGRQLQTLNDESIYVGNNGLCGSPLKKCLEDDQFPQGNKGVDDITNDVSEMPWFYCGFGFGFLAGFVGVCSLLYFKDSWRHACFQLVEKIYIKFSVAVAINKTQLQRKLRQIRNAHM